MALIAGVGVWMGGDNEEVRGGARRDVVALHSSAGLFVQVYYTFHPFTCSIFTFYKYLMLFYLLAGIMKYHLSFINIILARYVL